MQFVRSTYNVNFPLFNKVDVFGNNAAPVWKYLQGNAHIHALVINQNELLINCWLLSVFQEQCFAGIIEGFYLAKHTRYFMGAVLTQENAALAFVSLTCVYLWGRSVL